MAGVTRVLTNDGDPIIYPDGTVAVNKPITFQLVDFEKRQPISLFDAASDGGEYVTGSIVTATIGATGYFSVNLWPNTRGEAATLYKVLLPGTTVKPFYIQVSEGVGPQTLLSAKTAVDAVAPQTLSLFDALLAQIIQVANTATSLVTRTTNGLMSWQDKVKLDDLVAPDLSSLAPLDSPEFSGIPTAPTADAATNSTQIATTGFVQAVKAALTKASVGLGNVDNTADTNKPVSTVQQTVLDLKAPISSPAFTGTPTAPTAAGATNNTQLATTAFVQTAVGAKAPVNSPTFTGQVTAPIIVLGDGPTNQTGTAYLFHNGQYRLYNQSSGNFAGIGCDNTDAYADLAVKTGGGTTTAKFFSTGNLFVGASPVDDGVHKLQVAGHGKFTGGFGCNGKEAQLAATASPNATDLATAITLVNNLKAILIANGIAA